MKNNSLQNRSIYHDLLRILASFAVICIHVCAGSATWAKHQFNTPIWTYLNLFNSLSRFAVPVFVMLSGSFMIEKYEEGSLKKLYSKNIFRLICSFVFWSAVYVAFTIFRNLILQNPLNIKELIYQFIHGYGHLWFVPMLIFLYAITPFLKELCNNKNNIHYFFLLACIPIIYNFVDYYITIIPLVKLFDNAGFQFVSGYTILYILGYYLTKYDVQKIVRVLIYFFALISITATVLVSHWHYNSGHTAQNYVYEYLSPTVLVVSIAIFLLFKYEFSKIRFKECTQKFIVKLSSLTFGVYLSHMVFVEVVSKTPLTAENVHPVISVPLIVFIVFILGTLTTLVISKIPILKKYII